jgi:mannose-6-phosphate isomerase-like protein (cupin superfamily)
MVYNDMTGGYMPELLDIENNGLIDKQQIVDNIENNIEVSGYTIIELDDKRPWGAYFKLSDDDTAKFVNEFFRGLSLSEAQLGDNKAKLSPKILLVSPSQRLSWQYHNRRSELWNFITDGAYEKSIDDNEGNVLMAYAGDSVHFSVTERHRLIGCAATYSLVAEIWQHTDSNNPSDEDDIVRLSDDYNRN